MVELARKEQWDMPNLKEKMEADLHQLQRLAAAFVMEQKELGGDEFGSGSLFISHLLSLERRLGDFLECEPEAHHSTIEYIVQLRREYEWECDIYILMAFLHPSVQFRVGLTGSEEAYERVRATLIQLVQERSIATPITPVLCPKNRQARISAALSPLNNPTCSARKSKSRFIRGPVRPHLTR
jgi:hypothetical protein